MSHTTLSAEVNKDVCETFGCFTEDTAKTKYFYSLLLCQAILKTTRFPEFNSTDKETKESTDLPLPCYYCVIIKHIKQEY